MYDDLSGRRRVLGLVLLAASLAILARGQYLFSVDLIGPGMQVFAIGIGLAALLARVLPLELDSPALTAPPPLARWERLFLVGSFLGAALLRFPGLEDCPPGGFFDEAQNVVVASRILEGNFPVFVAESTQMPALFFYPVALAIALFGKSIAAVRAVSAFSGAVTIPLFFLLGRRFFSKSVAAAAAILLLGQRWHLNFSRIGFNGIMSPLLETLALLLLLRALEAKRARDWLAFGAVVGVGLQTYYAFSLFPAVLLVAVVGFTLRGGFAAFRLDLKPALKGLAWSAVAALVLLFPLIVFAIHYPEQFFQRAGTVAIWNPQHNLPMPETLFLNLRTHLLMWSYHGDANPRHNIPDAPLLTPIESVLLAFGIGAALGRGLKWPRPLLLAWAGVMLLPGILTIEAPQAYRTLGAAPAVVFLLAEGLEAISRLLARRDGRGAPRFALACAAVAVLVAGWNAVLYFQVQVRDPRVWRAFDADQKEIARFLARASPGHDVFIDPLFFDVPLFHVYLPDDFKSGRFRLSDHFPKPGRTAADLSLPGLFVLDGSQQDLVPLFTEAFPHAVSLLHADPTGRVMFVSVEVPAEERLPLLAVRERGFLGYFYRNDGWQGEPALVRRDPAVMFRFHWDADALNDPFSADWAAHLAIDRAGAYQFVLLSGGPAAVLVDGECLLRQPGFESQEPLAGSVDLEAGDHVLVVRYLENSYISTIRLWWIPPGGARSVIPLGHLTAFTPQELSALRPELPRLEVRP